MKILEEFKTFLIRGNILDLAVAVVVGAAFNNVVTALVKDIITPLIGAVGAKGNFSGLEFTVRNSTFMYGDFINAILTFLINAAAIFFLVVKPANAILARIKKKEDKESEKGKKDELEERECPECLSLIPSQAKRCKFCTAEVTPVTTGKKKSKKKSSK